MQVPPPTTNAGLSPDGNYWWDGAQWVTTLSPDGLWRWDGERWVPGPGARTRRLAAYHSPDGRRTFVVVCFALLIAFELFIASSYFYLASLFGDSSTLAYDFRILYEAGGRLAVLAFGVTAISLLWIATYIATVVAFLMWLHRCYRNLDALDFSDLRFTPGWAVGWWFIPLANIVRPFQVMAELWRHVASERTSTALVGIWWTIWLLSRALDFVSTRSHDLTLQGAVTALDTVPAVLAAAVVLVITGRLGDMARRRDADLGAASSAG